MTVTLSQQEVFQALKSVFGYPEHSTMEVTVGRGANPTKFTIEIPAFTQATSAVLEPEVDVSTPTQPGLFDKVD